LKPFTRRLIKKEVENSYIYIGLTRARDFPGPDVEFTIIIDGKEFKTRTYDWHCACRCPNPVHTHRCIDISGFVHLLPGEHPMVTIQKVSEGVYELEPAGGVG